MKINFGNVSKKYAAHRNDIPDKLVNSLNKRGVNFAGTKTVDLGSGTGALTRIIADKGADVIGIEPSLELIEEAETMDKAENKIISYSNRYAESTSLKSDFYDNITVMRAWHWFNREKVLKEAGRLLKENGRLIIIDSGFLSETALVQETMDLLKNHLPEQKLRAAGSKAQSNQLINSFPVEWFEEWKEKGFDLQDMFRRRYSVCFTNQEWCGRIGSLSWLSSLPSDQREVVLHKLYIHLTKQFGQVTHHVPHGYYAVILTKKNDDKDNFHTCRA